MKGEPNSIDRVIHEPARLLIVTYLSVIGSADFLFLGRQTGLTRGNLSSHLSRLEDAGYVDVKKEFVDKIPRTVVALTKPGLKALDGYRKRMKRLLAGEVD